MPINKDICAYFYETHGQGQYRCKRCGSECKQQVGTGYSNLIAHLAHKHEGFKDQFAATLSSNAQSLQDFGSFPKRRPIVSSGYDGSSSETCHSPRLATS
ncbi:Zinc finger, BED-type [Phytophthora cactorum]|nr:Zinc finger, BED-type [Phytophthora cactorum]